jgi:hypothetical protein
VTPKHRPFYLLGRVQKEAVSRAFGFATTFFPTIGAYLLIAIL